MELRDDYAAKEEATWRAFLSVVASVPSDRRDDPTVVPGWSVKDLIWHNAAWALFAATELQKLVGHPFTNPFETNDDADWDHLSETMIDEGRTKTFDEVLTDSERARERTSAIWSSLPSVEEPAAQWFAEETFIHYEEHMKEIQRYLSGTPSAQS